MRKKKINYKFLLFALILILLKQLLISKIPIFAIGDSSCDDLLMVNWESSILQLNWLGDFNSLTLTKGVFFPLFLSVNAFLGISYINAVSLFYSIACFVFILSIKDLFQKKWPLYIIFTLLLFNPIMYSLDVVQRVYRNSLIPGQVLLIFASTIAIFINRKNNKKSLWIWSVIGGLSLSSFYNTREDSIWILPMIVVFMLIMVIEYLITNKKNLKLKKIILYIMPLIILGIVNFSISSINYFKYGVFTRVDISNSSFANAIDAIYSVPTKKKIEYVSVTKEKLERLYKISPSLNSISKDLDLKSKEIDKYGRNSKDEEIEDGWFWWALRFAAEDNGYYKNAKKANEFFENITKEIKDAQKKGLIEKQSTMPSSLMSPWRKGYSKDLIYTLFRIIGFTNSFDTIKADAIESTGSYNSIKLFEIATNDRAIIPNINFNINGWYKYNEDDYQIKLVDKNTNEIIDKIDCKKEKTCSFTFDLKRYENISNIVIDVFDINNNSIERLNLNDKLNYDINEKREYKFYDYSIVNANIYQKKVSNVYISRLNIISKFYKIIGVLLGIISLIVYFILTYYTIKDHKLLDKWLVISSILASYLVLCIGISYNHISSCNSITTMYLSGTYPLIIMLWLLNIFTLINYKKYKF